MVNVTWPFRDVTSGYDLQEHLFYGVGDSGSMYCANFKTKEAAIKYIVENHDMDEKDIGTKPEQLSEYGVVVMTGREFVEEIHKRGGIDANGKWLWFD